MTALTTASATPMSAPPAMNPDARRIPRSWRGLTASGPSPGLGRETIQLRIPPSRMGVFSSIGRYIPRAKARAGTFTMRRIREKITPRAKRNHRTDPEPAPKIPTRISFMAEAWGAGMALVPKPWAGSVWDMTHMATPQKVAATKVPRNLRASWRAGVAPSQWPTFRSEERAPEAARPVQTTPPTIMVMNIP